MIVQRKVSDRGATQVAGQKLQVGHAHRNTLVDIHVDDTVFRVYDSEGELLASIPKTTTKDISRYKAYGWSDNIGQELSPISRCQSVTHLLRSDTVATTPRSNSQRVALMSCPAVA